MKAHLEELAAASSQKLNWKTSIVDLLKLLDLDSSYAARKDLAAELACPAEFMGDSDKMNMWLHKTGVPTGVVGRTFTSMREPGPAFGAVREPKVEPR